MYLASEFGRFYINRCNECLDFPCGCFCFSTDFWVCNRTIWHMRTLVISALDVLTFSTWVFCRRVSRSSTCEDVDTSLNVWFWIRWWVWQNRARSSAKSKSFNGVLRVHLVAGFLFFFGPICRHLHYPINDEQEKKRRQDTWQVQVSTRVTKIEWDVKKNHAKPVIDFLSNWILFASFSISNNIKTLPTCLLFIFGYFFSWIFQWYSHSLIKIVTMIRWEAMNCFYS